MARTKAFDEAIILDKALRLFWCKGYEATSMQDLVDGLGLSRSSIYDTFGDKRNLFLKTVELYRRQQARDLIQFLQNAPLTLQSIEGLLQATAEECIRDADRKGCFMVNTSLELLNRDPEIEQAVTQNNGQMEGAFREFLTNLQHQGALASHKSPVDLARFLLSSLSGLKVVGVAHPDRLFLRSIIQSTMEALK